MALSGWEPEHHHSWMAAIVPVFEPRRRSRLLTPYGWYIVLSAVSLVMGAILAFLT